MLLAVDTSSHAITAAVSDASATLGQADVHGGMLHGELLGVLVRDALSRANVRPSQLTGVVVGVGPGPFTGLRVGITFGSVFAAALDIPVWGVCSLDAVAASSGLADVGVVTDARRKEVYFARYLNGGRVGLPEVAKPEVAADSLAGLPIVGAGAAAYPGVFARADQELLNPSAADPATSVLLPDAGVLGRLAANWLSASDAGAPSLLLAPIPLYLRRPDAVASTARKRVTS